MKLTIILLGVITFWSQQSMGMSRETESALLKALANLSKKPVTHPTMPNIIVNVNTDVKGSAKTESSQAIVETEKEKPLDQIKVEIPEKPLTSLYESTTTYLSSFFNHNWGKCTVAFIITAYAAIYAHIYSSKNEILNSHNWAAWKEHIELSRLQSMNSQELATELVQDIQECCLYTKDTANTAAAFEFFLSQIAAEEKKINRYLFFAQAIYKARLSFLFPVSKQLIEQAVHRKERLFFVKKLFLKWNAQHNLRSLLK